MDLKKYFKKTEGIGVLSTADGSGKVDAAIYARPHFFSAKTAAFVMRDRLTHKNLRSNARAAYLFIEDGGGYKGVRLFLKKIHEEKNTERLEALRRRCCKCEEDDDADRFLVTFRIEKVLPLIGDKF